jgi:hypothetical protein
VVLAVGDIDPAVGVAADVVDDVELALAGSGFAPRHQQLAVGRVFVDACIAIAVGDVDLTPRGEGGVGTAVERLAAHKCRRFAGNAELEQDLTVQSDLADEMAAIVREEHRVVWRHVDAMGSRILPLAPRLQKIALSIEDDHRVLAAVEDVNVVVAVDADPANFLERPAVGQFCPFGNGAVFELAGSDDHRTLLTRIHSRSEHRDGAGKPQAPMRTV